jgi:hypothetical protein
LTVAVAAEREVVVPMITPEAIVASGRQVEAKAAFADSSNTARALTIARTVIVGKVVQLNDYWKRRSSSLRIEKMKKRDQPMGFAAII